MLGCHVRNNIGDGANIVNNTRGGVNSAVTVIAEAVQAGNKALAMMTAMNFLVGRMRFN